MDFPTMWGLEAQDQVLAGSGSSRAALIGWHCCLVTLSFLTTFSVCVLHYLEGHPSDWTVDHAIGLVCT